MQVMKLNLPIIIIVLICTGWLFFSSEVTEAIPVTDGLVSYWSGDGVTVDAQSGNDGTLMNGATFSDGKVGQAFSFDGVDDYVNINYHDSLNLISNFTIVFWAKRTDLNEAGYIITKGGYGTPGGWGVHWRNDKITFFTGGESRQDSNNVYTDIDWVHVAVAVNSNTVDFYRDGVGAGSIQASLSSNSVDIKLGTRNSGQRHTHFFDGLIDEVAIYDRVLLDTEIQTIYSDGQTPEPTTILLIGCGLCGLLGLVIRQRQKVK